MTEGESSGLRYSEFDLAFFYFSCELFASLGRPSSVGVFLVVPSKIKILNPFSKRKRPPRCLTSWRQPQSNRKGVVSITKKP